VGEEFTPFLRFDTEIRRIVWLAAAFPTNRSRVYMATMSRGPTGKDQARWTMR
jgi:hypothetical protein